MKKYPTLIFLLACITFVSVPLQGICEDTAYQEGVFKVVLPSTWTRMSKEMVEEMKGIMLTGGRELAEASKLADSKAISEETFPFLSGFQLRAGDKRILLVFAGFSSPEILDREEMCKTNAERVQWGIDSGRLKKNSKGVSKLDIDGIPCLLQDIVVIQGGRMQMYLFFVPEYPKMSYCVQLIADDSDIWDKYSGDISSMISSMKVARKAGEQGK